jgi:hypothetical protein
MMAVSTAMGLKMPGSQMDRGVSSVLDHLLNWSTLRSRSMNQERRPRLLGHAYFSQEVLWKGLRPGTWFVDGEGGERVRRLPGALVEA